MSRWHVLALKPVHPYLDMTHKFTYLPPATNSEYLDAVDWCWDNIGVEGTRWRSVTTLGIIYIQAEDNAFAFKMRWC